MTAQVILLIVSGAFFYEAFIGGMKNYKISEGGKPVAIVFGTVFLLLCLFWNSLPG